MVAFVYRMPSGIPGALSRTGQAFIVEPGILLAGSVPPAYGLPVAVDASTGHMRAIKAGDTAASVYGILVRPFPTQGGDGTNTPLGSSPPPASGQCDVLKLGYISVAVANGTPAKNGTVYVRVAANGSLPNTAVGDIEAAADGTNTVALTNAYFTGAADSSGNAEIAFNV